jgi:flavin reductase (DIM6/NTAB) family NADH-FMN oxidoreductase RutF
MLQEKVGEALRKLPLPVTVATVGRGGVDNALTISWVAPLSFDPPRLMMAVDKLHYSVEFLESTKNFVINVLGGDQSKLAGHFARQSMSDEDKLDEVRTREAPSGGAILTDALAYFDCEVHAIHEAGDHLMVVGTILEAEVLRDGEPLHTTAGLRYQKKLG